MNIYIYIYNIHNDNGYLYLSISVFVCLYPNFPFNKDAHPIGYGPTPLPRLTSLPL